MKISRGAALIVHTLLDQLLPPFLRDSKWLMLPALKLVLGEHTAEYMEFKRRAPIMSAEEFRAAYRRMQTSFIDRETDLNEACTARILAEVQGKRVLEVGCGKGFLAKELVKKELDVTAVDIVIADEVRAIAGLKTVEVDGRTLPFKDAEFDTVICTHTLEHVQDFAGAVAELRRVGKRVIIVVPCQRPYQYTFDLHLHFFPYSYSLLQALGNVPATAICEKVGGDLYYREDR